MSLTIWASTLSEPRVVARYRNAPVLFTVPPTTVSPGRLDTGRGSPVSMDSSTALEPLTTSPSTGTRSPGRTETRSPRRTLSSGTSSSASSRTTRAVVGWSPMSARRAVLVCPFARASSMLPRRTRATMTITAS